MKRSCITFASVLFFAMTSTSCFHKHRSGSVAQTRPPQTIGGTQPAPIAVPTGHSEEGIASWYGVPFNGRRAADGEIYNMETLVAAHRTLPFNTWLRVTNLTNNEAVNVRVIDRGPFVNGRILDLSKAAARNIHLLGPGVGRVRIEVIAEPVSVPTNELYAVQVGAFGNYQSAEHLREQYASRFGNAQLAQKQGQVTLWRVLVGKEASIAAAQELSTMLGAENKSVFVVRLDESVPKPTAAGQNALPDSSPPITPP